MPYQYIQLKNGDTLAQIVEKANKLRVPLENVVLSTHDVYYNKGKLFKQFLFTIKST